MLLSGPEENFESKPSTRYNMPRSQAQAANGARLSRTIPVVIILWAVCGRGEFLGITDVIAMNFKSVVESNIQYTRSLCMTSTTNFGRRRLRDPCRPSLDFPSRGHPRTTSYGEPIYLDVPAHTAGQALPFESESESIFHRIQMP